MAVKKYTPRTLGKAVQRYFDSISRDEPVTERKPTGELDKYGHPVYADVPVCNRLGEQLERLVFLEPPTVSAMCLALGIHRSTWADYCQDESFSDTTSYAQGVMRAWNENQLLTRPGKDIPGIKFNLENNYGYRDRQSVITPGMSVEQYLRSLGEEGVQEF